MLEKKVEAGYSGFSDKPLSNKWEKRQNFDTNTNLNLHLKGKKEWKHKSEKRTSFYNDSEIENFKQMERWRHKQTQLDHRVWFCSPHATANINTQTDWQPYRAKSTSGWLSRVMCVCVCSVYHTDPGFDHNPETVMWNYEETGSVCSCAHRSDWIPCYLTARYLHGLDFEVRFLVHTVARLFRFFQTNFPALLASIISDQL